MLFHVNLDQHEDGDHDQDGFEETSQHALLSVNLTHDNQRKAMTMIAKSQYITPMKIATMTIMMMMMRSEDLAAVHVTEQQLEVVGLHILRHHDHTVIMSCASLLLSSVQLCRDNRHYHHHFCHLQVNHCVMSLGNSLRLCKNILIICSFTSS